MGVTMTPSEESTPAAPTAPVDFIRTIVDDDLAAGKNHGRVVTRFPPEPNGYLHIGHAKSICLNFGVAVERGGKCNLRFDDTNPTKEDVEYVDSIKEDVAWLGFKWDDMFFASDYFEQLYQFRRRTDPKGQGIRRRAHCRSDRGIPRHAHRTRQRTARSAIVRSRRAWTSSHACAPASSRTASTCCARRST
jgi:hypothetical protein